MSTFALEPDGDGEMTLWRITDPERTGPTAWTTQFIPLWRRCDVNPELRDAWDEVVNLIIAGSQPAWYAFDTLPREGTE